MTAKKKIVIAKVLIFISICLFATSFVLTIMDGGVVDPERDTEVVSSNNNGITITTIDDTSIDNNDEEIVPDSDDIVNIPSPKPSPKPSPSPSNVPGGVPSNPPVQKPSPTPSPVPSPSAPPVNNGETNPAVPTVDQVNNRLRNNLQNKYGVIIKFGSETEGYNVAGLTTVPISNSYTIQSALTTLSNQMALYPNGFFDEIKKGGIPLTIYLVKRYSNGNVTGVTDSNYSRAYMSLATDFAFAETFNHETYHYVERYISKLGGSFSGWNSLNPTNFKYGTISSDYSYNTTFSADAYFVNNYAQTDEFEDRASTFEYMMDNSKPMCLNYGKRIWLKARYMCETIDLIFNTVSPNTTEYWERFIY